ncbi:hypothetical protein AVEN_187856-1 [Araneus ventricosus]|uniref:Uncharacterized protein n=1 Tax=Araneus ventricosus TaxID=182803 RepID=A0A4Y2CSB6_ARAVE|nr:hypothetical protein AVEN_187856-1 [Araneus ventricosus]
MALSAVDGDLMLEDKVKFGDYSLCCFKSHNSSHSRLSFLKKNLIVYMIFLGEYLRKSLLMLRTRMNFRITRLTSYVETVSSLVSEKNLESEQESSMIDLFIELKNEFTAFRKDIYNEVDSFSKLIFRTDDIRTKNLAQACSRK